jgi:hypothetical protein
MKKQDYETGTAHSLDDYIGKDVYISGLSNPHKLVRTFIINDYAEVALIVDEIGNEITCDLDKLRILVDGKLKKIA